MSFTQQLVCNLLSKFWNETYFLTCGICWMIFYTYSLWLKCEFRNISMNTKKSWDGHFELLLAFSMFHLPPLGDHVAFPCNLVVFNMHLYHISATPEVCSLHPPAFIAMPTKPFCQAFPGKISQCVCWFSAIYFGLHLLLSCLEIYSAVIPQHFRISNLISADSILMMFPEGNFVPSF